ncbi:helix-turn-helix domain-containing protein [Pseudomonas mosselii]|uniref:helix-turn-helix domain-containing protein n=1 Tax=Pseudomonas mosselii TaxID=78327 RepID=UPI002448F8F0|nr:helix-turn-helix transcriptional regulator [Pseudomonas mosselii]MDH1526722.1 helix-turn-helix transcriptional regulator [Pseudomonas mosselii]
MHLLEEMGARLQAERKRLGLTQDELAFIVGVSKRTLASYEAGTREPGAALLNHATAAGVDVLYVVTGQRVPTPEVSIGADEMEALQQIRALSAEDRGAVGRLLAAFSRK